MFLFFQHIACISLLFVLGGFFVSFHVSLTEGLMKINFRCLEELLLISWNPANLT